MRAIACPHAPVDPRPRRVHRGGRASAPSRAAGKPIVVGGDGDQSKRGVVSTASYEARVFGIRSAMPRTAYKAQPEAIFLAVDADAHLAASREVMDTLRTFEARVEVAGWDEAFPLGRDR